MSILGAFLQCRHTGGKIAAVSARFFSVAREGKTLPKDGPSLHDFLRNSAVVSSSNEEQNGDVRPFSFRLESRLVQGKFYLETYGCQMNVSDSEIVHSILMEAGYDRTEDIEQADVILANTCAVRENPEKKVHHRLAYFNSLKKKKVISKNVTVGLLGCMAERLKSNLLDGGAVDLVVGPDAYRGLPALVAAARADPAAAALDVQLSRDETYADIAPVRHNAASHSAFVSIMRGCNNMCTYCIVPFTRGRERSRDFETILGEVERLRDEGVKEITLLGQNVNSYHDTSAAALGRWPACGHARAAGFADTFRARAGGGARFADLLEEVARAAGPEVRVRFTSPHPKDFPDRVWELLARHPGLCRQVHLPAQSGSTRVLAAMRRGYGRAAYLELVGRARGLVPGLQLSSDFISGFCGETEEDHRATLDLLEQVGYSQAFMYAYSLRERTRAAYRLEDDVPRATKLRRLQEVIDCFHRTAAAGNRRELGRTHLVLVEGPAKRGEGLLTGRTDTNKRVVFAGERPGEGGAAAAAAAGPQGGQGGARSPPPPCLLRPGDYAAVRIEAATGHTLRGAALGRASNAGFFRATGGRMVLEEGEAWAPEEPGRGRPLG